MDDPHLMAVADGVNDWSDGIGCLPLRELVLFDDAAEQLSSFHQLENQIKPGLVFENLEKLHDVRVVNLLSIQTPSPLREHFFRFF